MASERDPDLGAVGSWRMSHVKKIEPVRWTRRVAYAENDVYDDNGRASGDGGVRGGLHVGRRVRHVSDGRALVTGRVPGIADQAKFTTAGTYGVSFTGDATNRYATVGASAGATVAFDLDGYTWWLTNNFAFANTGTARFSGGRLRVGCDNQTNSTSTITVAANQKLVLTNNATDFMGNLNTSAGGTIEALGGDTIVSWAVNLNAAPEGMPSLRMTAGSFSLTNKLEGSRFTLNDGAKVSLDGGDIFGWDYDGYAWNQS